MDRIVLVGAVLLGTMSPAFAVATVLPEPTTLSVFGLGVGGAYLFKRFISRK
jgi:hypothetical protein